MVVKCPVCILSFFSGETGAFFMPFVRKTGEKRKKGGSKTMITFLISLVVLLVGFAPSRRSSAWMDGRPPLWPIPTG